ncbi:MAG: Zn-finger nucleic acid-binding protein [Gemmatimonadetes bacterium]|jgi:Zn-finger nucleic acid-binding protein|nr:Zn-finger nucleic acid-binding protein [Gemmatimonadota bacterium]
MPEQPRPRIAPPTLETRLPCPVCLGVMMEKLVIGGAGAGLTVDHCGRCGGVWFEQGEARQLSRLEPSELWKHIPPRQSAPTPPCHGCHAPLDRGAAKCAVCGRANTLPCPACERTMERRQHGTLTLDVCARDRGVWFDHAELRSVWSLALERVDAGQRDRGRQALAVGGDVLLESLFWAPGLTLHAGAAVVQGAGSVVSAAGGVSAEGAAAAATGAVDMIGGAAQGVFEFVMEMIGGIFDD